MTINEIAKELNITKRAIKYYEEQGLLNVAKDSNGYRNYSKQDAETLRIISVYRKLGISISDIKRICYNCIRKYSFIISKKRE